MPTTSPSSVSKSKGKITVYFLAAPEDEEQTKSVRKYLSPVVRNSKIPIEILSDFEIPPGQDINEYKLQLYDADIVLAFISADFINDDQTYIRTQKVIEKYNNDETVMLPILVRNCMWKSTPFVNLPLLPKNTQPLNNKQFWNSEDDALTSVVNDIYESINEFSYENVEDEVVTPEVEQDTPEADITELLDEVEIEAPVEEPIVSSLAATEIVEEPIEEVIPETDPEIEIIDEVEPQVEQVEEVVEAKRPKEPIIEKEIKKQTEKPEKKKKIANTDLEVDWRKAYYRRVLRKRTFAFILDQFLSFIPLMVIGFAIGASLFEMSLESAWTPKDTFIMIFPFIFYAAICAIAESTYRGTWGKLIMKMEITNRKGNRIGFFRAFLRNILRFITGYLMILGAVGAVVFLIAIIGSGAGMAGTDFWMLLGLIPITLQIILYRKYKKLFHDQISYTVVGERLKK